MELSPYKLIGFMWNVNVKVVTRGLSLAISPLFDCAESLVLAMEEPQQSPSQPPDIYAAPDGRAHSLHIVTPEGTSNQNHLHDQRSPLPNVEVLTRSRTLESELYDSTESPMMEDDTDPLQSGSQSQSLFEVPGGMHSWQIMTEPETVNEQDPNRQDRPVGLRAPERPSFFLQYETIDEMTQAGDLTHEVKVNSGQPVALGGCSDIYPGKWHHRASIDDRTHFREATTSVAVKLLRAFTRHKVDLPRARKHLRKEAAVWKRLNHQNIARFYGVSFQFDGRPAVVMQWYKNGTAPQYLEDKPQSKKFEMVVQVARGLKYLHVDGQIVHGDIKGNNILVSDEGFALLSDFGLAGVVEDFAGSEHTTTALSGSLRWQAPELLAMDDDVDSNKTPASDVWAFGCTAFELLDHNLPYHWLNNDYAILRSIFKGQRPVREKDGRSELSKSLQETLGDCWARAAAERIGIEKIVERLENVVRE